MKQFFIRILNLLLICTVLLAYQQRAQMRALTVAAYEQEAEEAAALSAEYERQTAEAKAAAEGIAVETQTAYADGVYQGTAAGFGGDILVEITVRSGVITKVDVLSHDGEDDAYFAMAQTLTDDILAAQSADVDTVSGATFSSTGIKNAAAQALEAAK